MLSLNKQSQYIYFRFRNLILYGIIGTISASTDFLLFYGLTSILNIKYIIANIISIMFGISLSFFLNREYNFKVKNKILKRMSIFFLIGLLGLILSSYLLYLFIEIAKLDKIEAKLSSIILVIIVQFILNNYITFRKGPK